MYRTVARSHVLNAIGDDEPSRAHLKSDIPLLKRRGVLLNKALFVFHDQGDYHVRACNRRVRERIPQLRARVRSCGSLCARRRILHRVAGEPDTRISLHERVPTPLRSREIFLKTGR